MRFYRLLLHLYPTSFRIEYGDELASVFAARRAGASGFLAGLVTMLAAIADIVPSALAAHWDVLQQDLRYTARALRRAPGFAVTTMLVVALGVGANTAAFSVADFVLLRPLPFPDPDRLVLLWERTPGYPAMELSPANFRDWKHAAKSFDGIGGFTVDGVNLVSDGEPLRVQSARVTHDVLPILGTQPLLGRLFTAADTVANRSVVLSHELWSSHFGADRSVIGRTIDLDGSPFTVIGVMPASFHFPNRTPVLWTTLALEAPLLVDRGDNWLNVVGRLRPGVTLEAAAAELNVIAKQLELQYPKENEKTGALIYRLRDDMSERTRVLLLALCGAALCTLLLACANLASLLLARGVGREREIAVRAALGAGRERLVRQLVTESVVLAAIGGAIGVGVAVLTVPALNRLVPNIPSASQPSVDLRVLAFASVLVILTGLGFGVFPAMRSGRGDTIRSLRDGGRSGGGRKQRARAVLVMIEVMMSVALLTSAGLLVRAMWRVQSVDLGFATANILSVRTSLPGQQYATVSTRAQFYSTVLSQIRAVPGVQSAAYTSFTPMTMGGGIFPVLIKGGGTVRDAANSASLRFVTSGFFATLRIPVRSGRDVADTDDDTRPNVAVVSESFARRYWPNEDPIGKQFRFAFRERMVVGVVGDIRVRGPEKPSEPQVYVPSRQAEEGLMFFYAPKDLLIRSSAPPAMLLPEIRRIVRSTDPRQPISNVQTMEQIVSDGSASRVAQLRVLGALAAIALLLASVGLHGLLSFTVSRRSQEIGVRVALGAQSQRILRMILGEGLVLAAGGLIPGVLLAYWAARGMQAVLAGVRPSDPATFAGAITICVAMSLIGCLRPALRASRVDPATALRSE